MLIVLVRVSGRESAESCDRYTACWTMWARVGTSHSGRFHDAAALGVGVRERTVGPRCLAPVMSVGRSTVRAGIWVTSVAESHHAPLRRST